ncbi:MAG TPA: hypothetical protein DCE44_24105 [Verrucomicrobiales bacterium]|nr:hypothetical protein [Verrucomicrobiales bacterium]
MTCQLDDLYIKYDSKAFSRILLLKHILLGAMTALIGVFVMWLVVLSKGSLVSDAWIRDVAAKYAPREPVGLGDIKYQNKAAQNMEAAPRDPVQALEFDIKHGHPLTDDDRTSIFWNVLSTISDTNLLSSITAKSHVEHLAGQAVSMLPGMSVMAETGEWSKKDSGNDFYKDQLSETGLSLKEVFEATVKHLLIVSKCDTIGKLLLLRKSLETQDMTSAKVGMLYGLCSLQLNGEVQQYGSLSHLVEAMPDTVKELYQRALDKFAKDNPPQPWSGIMLIKKDISIFIKNILGLPVLFWIGSWMLLTWFPVGWLRTPCRLLGWPTPQAFENSIAAQNAAVQRWVDSILRTQFNVTAADIVPINQKR